MIRWWHAIFLLITLFTHGQGDQVWLHPNRGQWDSRIDYKVDLKGGEMLIEPKGFTYNFVSIPHHHNNEDAHAANEERHYPSHVIKTTFIGANAPSAHTEENPSSFYRNYFLSSDSHSWKSNVHSLKQVTSKQVYNGIDLLIEGGNSSLKYSWIVAPGMDASVIRWSYAGTDDISVLENGELRIGHTLGTITEGKPVAWLIHNGKKLYIDIRYELKGNTLTFDWDGPDSFGDTLVIDPSLTFSTFTGSLADNWGFTAAPDQNGNLYAGGIVFAGGYPTFPGTYDLTYNGGTGSLAFDVAISKFNADGTSMLYSTYLGGSGNETPHSIVTNAAGELFVFGVTGSFNFPMAGNSFDPTYNGGPFMTNVNELDFDGSDIYIARFSANGQTLMASTFVGGTGNDGLNVSNLSYNYGDPFRGEIIVSATDVYVVSSSSSTNFPTVNTTATTLNGLQDAVVFKMDYGLSTMHWSRYFGGSGNDAGNGVEISSTGGVYITGGTSSTSLGFSAGHDLTYNGGSADGFLARLSGTNGATVSGTFIGTGEYDQSYFVQLDLDDQVYIYGQTEGTIPVSAGCYGNSNSGQFVAKYTTDLTTQNWTTVVGAGSGHVEISPTAFLVSNCKDIYLSGWGGSINANQGGQAIFSSSNGFPTTSDAYQSNTNGSNFWVAVLDENAAFLKYATFMGGVASSFNHVDGGTSRFDKSGTIYHAVCGACGGQNFGFTTTPGVWAPQNLSTNCNLAAFKFELSKIEAIVSDPDPLICIPDPVIFQNNSANGNAFDWDFGDNTTSTAVNPSHVYQNPGHYTITLIVTDTNQCYAPDTIQFEINIGDFQGGVVQPSSAICPGQSYQFDAYGGANYLWSPAQFLNNPNISNPVATVTQNTEFTCIISDSCGVDTVHVWLNVFGGAVQVSNDTTICVGNPVPLFVTGVASATWSPSTYLDDPNSLNPISNPANNITYTVTGTTLDGCALNEQVAITVVFNPPIPMIADTVFYCEGLSNDVWVSGADQYTWYPPIEITPLTGPQVTISATTERYYYCDFTNACGTLTDSIYAKIVLANIHAGNDTIVCPGQPAFMYATGGVSYTWNPPVNPLNNNASQVFAIAPATNTVYTVVGLDANGCYDSSYVTVDLFPQPFIQTSPDVYAYVGDVVQLYATSTTPGPYVWSPGEYLSCVTCMSPTAMPDKNFVYTVTYTDANGCSASDDIHIFYDPILYVPNAFTPDGSRMNDEFFAVAGNVKSLKLEIFDRWGEMVYSGYASDKAWDGTYEGLPCPDGVYTWKIKYVDFSDETHTAVGHVSLLR